MAVFVNYRQSEFAHFFLGGFHGGVRCKAGDSPEGRRESGRRKSRRRTLVLNEAGKLIFAGLVIRNFLDPNSSFCPCSRSRLGSSRAALSATLLIHGSSLASWTGSTGF